MEKPKIVFSKTIHRQYSYLLRVTFSVVDELYSKRTLMGELTWSEERWLQELENALGEVDLPSLEALQLFYRNSGMQMPPLPQEDQRPIRS